MADLILKWRECDSKFVTSVLQIGTCLFILHHVHSGVRLSPDYCIPLEHCCVSESLVRNDKGKHKSTLSDGHSFCKKYKTL